MNLKPSIYILILCLIFATVYVSAQTVVEGNVSGTWDIGGSPYLVIDDCTVQTGEELVIEPGVEIVFGESMSLYVNGKISAIGDSSQHIIFRAVNNSVKFDRVHVKNGSSTPPVSEFKFCEFMDAQTGLYLHAYGMISNAYTTLQTDVFNCIFESSVSTAIYVRAQAVDGSTPWTPHRLKARANPVIKGCTFIGNGEGIEMKLQGAGTAWFSNADTEAIIQNNAFLNLPGVAINMLPGAGPAHSGTPSFINNTFVNCDRGVWIQDGDFDATTLNNIFCVTDTAIERTGSNSSTAFYNCFYNNAINFVGYPSSYGDIVMVNTNGDSCDIGFNIFQDPLFDYSNDFILLPDSPCIDAGDPDEQYNDIEDPLNPGFALPPASGTVRNDMGAYGGGYPLDSLLIVNVKDTETNIPTNFILLQNYPNPFNQTTTILYTLHKAEFITLTIYDMFGREVQTLLNEFQASGSYTVDFVTDNLSSGIYLYKLQVGDFSSVKKMHVLQ